MPKPPSRPSCPQSTPLGGIDATWRHRLAQKPQCLSSKRCQSLRPVSIFPVIAGFHRSQRRKPRQPVSIRSDVTEFLSRHHTRSPKQHSTAPTPPKRPASHATNLSTTQDFNDSSTGFARKTQSPLPYSQTVTMTMQLPHVTLSYRGSSSSSSPLKGQLRLYRGAYVQLPFDPSSAKPWDIWESIAMARIIASVQQGDPTPLVVGTSALLLHGVQGWIANPNVELYQPKRRISQLIPPCRCGTVPMPAVRRVYRRTPPITSERTRVSGLLTEHPYDALIRCAMHDDALQAFALGCSALRKWCDFSNFSQDVCRGRAENIRKEILSRLERERGRRGCVRAQRILSSIDPGCDNPAEAALTWVVRALCPYEVSTQYELSTGGRRFFADIAIPQRKLIIEFDGIEKLGSTQGEFDRAKRSWVQREQALQDQGWRFLRVNWLDFNDWNALRGRISHAIGVASTPIPARYALLWEPPSERCNGEGRRFRAHEWHGSDGGWT